MKSLKTWWALAAAVLTDTTILVQDDHLSVNDWLTIGATLATAAGVYLFPNLKKGENVQNLADEALNARAARDAKRFE